MRLSRSHDRPLLYREYKNCHALSERIVAMQNMTLAMEAVFEGASLGHHMHCESLVRFCSYAVGVFSTRGRCIVGYACL